MREGCFRTSSRVRTSNRGGDHEDRGGGGVERAGALHRHRVGPARRARGPPGAAGGQAPGRRRGGRRRHALDRVRRHRRRLVPGRHRRRRAARSAASTPLVYAPAIGPLSRIEDVDADTWRAVFDTNVVGASLVTAAALPHLAASSGRAIYLSSVSASQTPPWPGLGAYAVSKAALDKLVEAWRVEHPHVGFTRMVVGDCMGGEDDAQSHFSQGWEPELAGEMATIWVERGPARGLLRRGRGPHRGGRRRAPQRAVGVDGDDRRRPPPRGHRSSLRGLARFEARPTSAPSLGTVLIRVLRDHLRPYKRTLALIVVLQVVQVAVLAGAPQAQRRHHRQGRARRRQRLHPRRAASMMLVFALLQVVFAVAADALRRARWRWASGATCGRRCSTASPTSRPRRSGTSAPRRSSPGSPTTCSRSRCSW